MNFVFYFDPYANTYKCMIANSTIYVLGPNADHNNYKWEVHFGVKYLHDTGYAEEGFCENATDACIEAIKIYKTWQDKTQQSTS